MDKDRKVRGAAGEVVNPGRGELRVEREKEIERERWSSYYSELQTKDSFSIASSVIQSNNADSLTSAPPSFYIIYYT